MIRLLAGVCFAGLAGFFGLAFYQRYWRWRDCFNEIDRCYDAASQEVFLEQAGVAWGSPTVICLATAMALLIWARRN
jgi:hypothetical protein